MPKVHISAVNIEPMQYIKPTDLVNLTYGPVTSLQPYSLELAVRFVFFYFKIRSAAITERAGAV